MAAAVARGARAGNALFARALDPQRRRGEDRPHKVVV